MRKTFKKLAAMAMAATMVIGCAMSAMAADAVFSLADADWSYQVWGDKDGASTTVDGAGDYSMVLKPYEGEDEDKNPITITAEGATVFVIDIKFGADALKAQNYRVSALSLTVDGEAFTIDTSKIVTGDIEGNGNMRIELFNAYGPTAVNQKYDATVSPFDPSTLVSTESIKVDFTLVETDEPAYDADDESITYTGLYVVEDDEEDDNAGAGDDTNTDADDNTNTNTTPNTGDSSMVAFYVVVAAAAAAVVLKKRTATN